MSQPIHNKFTVVKKGDKVVFNKFVQSSRIDTLQGIQTVSNLSEAPSATIPPFPAIGEQVKFSQLYQFGNKLFQCVVDHLVDVSNPNTSIKWYKERNDNGNLIWRPYEIVEIGDVRKQQGVKYDCILSHATEVGDDMAAMPLYWQLH